ncbi:MAG TPA: beta-ketoacyl-ACP synthase 3 [Solirubrobacterales bacterium]|nr:beta-ketoacyl-ACP synthase 3 [Solirubrobacterales bacterium]
MPEPLAVPARAAAAPGCREGAAVTGLGIALPATVVGNAAIAARFGVDDEWIVQRTGIRERRVAGPEERLADFATSAGSRALADAGLAAADLDLVVLATSTNERVMPAAAGEVAAELGAERAGAYDVSAACTGFLAALSIACGQVEAGRASRVLVIGADLMTRITDAADRATAALFGDGAGAVVVQSADQARIGPLALGSDGANGELIYVDAEERLIRMQGHETFRHAVARMSEATLRAIESAGLGLEDIDLFVYHQANARILKAVAERLGLPPGRVMEGIERVGNTSAASIPLALDAARQAGELRPGARVLIAAFGAGLSWGAATLTWGSG